MEQQFIELKWKPGNTIENLTLNKNQIIGIMNYKEDKCIVLTTSKEFPRILVQETYEEVKNKLDGK